MLNIINLDELNNIKKDTEKLSWIYTHDRLKMYFRFFINGNEEITLGVYNWKMENEKIVTVSKEFFYTIMDEKMINKTFEKLLSLYNS